MYVVSMPLPGGTGVQAGGMTLRMAGAVRRWWLERRTREVLEALDDAALKDIGLYRCAIPWTAWITHAETGSRAT
jgi:uncharacterized protein YjiS (DUF1127 family)